jgi:hypothetical protein
MANAVGEMEAQHPPRKRTMVLESPSCGEYLRYQLDDTNANFALGGLAASIKLKDTGNIARARINYKF